MFIDICKMYREMHIFYTCNIATEEENIYAHIPRTKSIGGDGLHVELQITKTDFKNCHKVLE